MAVESLFMMPMLVTVLLGRQPRNPYLDEIASLDTIMLPALNPQLGAIQLTTLGNAMTMAELDTIEIPAIQQYRSSTSSRLKVVKTPSNTMIISELDTLKIPKIQHHRSRTSGHLNSIKHHDVLSQLLPDSHLHPKDQLPIDKISYFDSMSQITVKLKKIILQTPEHAEATSHGQKELMVKEQDHSEAN